MSRNEENDVRDLFMERYKTVTKGLTPCKLNIVLNENGEITQFRTPDAVIENSNMLAKYLDYEGVAEMDAELNEEYLSEDPEYEADSAKLYAQLEGQLWGGDVLGGENIRRAYPIVEHVWVFFEKGENTHTAIFVDADSKPLLTMIFKDDATSLRRMHKAFRDLRPHNVDSMRSAILSLKTGDLETYMIRGCEPVNRGDSRSLERDLCLDPNIESSVLAPLFEGKREGLDLCRDEMQAIMGMLPVAKTLFGDLSRSLTVRLRYLAEENAEVQAAKKPSWAPTPKAVRAITDTLAEMRAGKVYEVNQIGTDDTDWAQRAVDNLNE